MNSLDVSVQTLLGFWNESRNLRKHDAVLPALVVLVG